MFAGKVFHKGEISFEWNFKFCFYVRDQILYPHYGDRMVNSNGGNSFHPNTKWISI